MAGRGILLLYTGLHLMPGRARVCDGT